MLTNEILYRTVDALGLKIDDIVEIYQLVQYDMDREHLSNLLSKRQDSDFELCTHEELGLFLDGLIVSRRGESKNQNSSDEPVELTNNLILKKLRVALEFREAEVEIVFGLADVELSKQQLSSLFRKATHKNYKECSDELLLAFIEGLSEFYYDGVTEEI